MLCNANRANRPRIASGWCLVAVLGGILVGGAHARGQPTSFWLNPVSGDWTDPTKWSSNPVFPNNGSQTFDVTIAAAGSPYSVLFNSPAIPVNVDSLDLDSPNVTLVHAAGTLKLGRIELSGGGSPALRVGAGARYRLHGGTLELATGNTFNLVGTEGTGSFQQQAGTVQQRGSLLVGFGGGSFGSGVGSLAIQGGQWLHDPLNVLLVNDFTGVGVGADGAGSFTLTNGARATMYNVSIGDSLGTGTCLINNGAQLAANRLNVGNGPLSLAGSGTSGFGVATLAGASSITLSSLAGFAPGVLFIGGGSDGLGSGKMVVEGGTLEAQATIVTRTGVLDIDGGRALLGSTLGAGISGSILLSGSGNLMLELCSLTQGGRLEVSGGSLNISQLSVSNGNQTISATGGALSVGSFTQQSGASSFAGNCVLTSNAIAIGGSAQFNVAGGTVNTLTLTMSGGNVNFSGGMFNISNLQINDGRFTLAPAANVRIDVNSLDVDGPGILDVADNRLSIDYTGPSPIDEIAEDVARAYAGGAWTGSGITSSLANASTHGVGYGDFANTSVIVHLTRYGDANLDDLVNLFDFNALAANFGTSGARWDQGDFNYDRLVNLADFNRLAGNFGLSASPSGPTPADWAALASMVPEPGAGMLVLGGAMATLLRRRR